MPFNCRTPKKPVAFLAIVYFLVIAFESFAPISSCQECHDPHSEKGLGPTVSIPVVSWNVWFGPPHQVARMDAIARVLMDTRHTYTGKPVFIGMQEVTTDLTPHLYPKLQAAGFEIIKQPLSRSNRYGCAIAVRTGGFINASDSVAEIFSTGFVPFSNSIMNRGFLWVHARVAQPTMGPSHRPLWHEVLFTTTHLESYLGPSYNGVKERASQLLQIGNFCQEYLNRNPSVSLAVMTGDLNWDDERYKDSTEKAEPLDKPILSIVGDQWIDAWLVHNTADSGITFDQVGNPMLQGNLKRRFDRVLLLPRENTESGASSLKAILHTQLVGTNAIPGITLPREDGFTSTHPILPSDHYGLVVNVQL